jgi:sulfur-oxidizing protein SoxZ
LLVQHGNKTIMSAQFGAAVSKNPYIYCKFLGGVKSDTNLITATWTDSRNDVRKDTAKIV